MDEAMNADSGDDLEEKADDLMGGTPDTPEEAILCAMALSVSRMHLAVHVITPLRQHRVL
ncbi:hypothetical protein PC128_g18390 [Phytophthora cactorum]|nr:hypothetical protein PC128_g18390 [Phytophthora cactorum]